MTKRVFVIHGWGGSPKNDWLPWLKVELEKRGFEVVAPAMPDTDNPKMDAWVEHLEKTVGKPDKDCYFVGHSLGCITILRYIEKVEADIDGVVFVAGFSDDLGIKELNNFFTKPIDWNKIKSYCKKIIAIHSDNDYYVPLRHGDIFKEKLGAELIVVHAMKHFIERDGVVELPIALDSILKLSK